VGLAGLLPALIGAALDLLVGRLPHVRIGKGLLGPAMLVGAAAGPCGSAGPWCGPIIKFGRSIFVPISKPSMAADTPTAVASLNSLSIVSMAVVRHCAEPRCAPYGLHGPAEAQTNRGDRAGRLRGSAQPLKQSKTDSIVPKYLGIALRLSPRRGCAILGRARKYVKSQDDDCARAPYRCGRIYLRHPGGHIEYEPFCECGAALIRCAPIPPSGPSAPLNGCKIHSA
jgi:hypothetical protein